MIFKQLITSLVSDTKTITLLQVLPQYLHLICLYYVDSNTNTSQGNMTTQIISDMTRYSIHPQKGLHLDKRTL